MRSRTGGSLRPGGDKQWSGCFDGGDDSGRTHQFLNRAEDLRPCRRGRIGDGEVTALDLHELCVLPDGRSGLGIGHTLREWDPVVGP